MDIQSLKFLSAANDAKFRIALCALDREVPVTPSGGDDGCRYFMSSADFEKMAPTLIDKPLKMAMPATSHYNADGSPAIPFGVIKEWSVEECPDDDLPEGTYAVISGVAWADDFPIPASITSEETDDWGSSWEIVGSGADWAKDEEGRVCIGSDVNPATFKGAVILPRSEAAYQEFTKILAASGQIAAVYSGPNDSSLPDAVKKLSDKKREVFVGAFNGAFRSWSKETDREYDKSKPDMANREAYAFRVAWSATNKVNAATDEEKAAQEARSRRYGIAIRDDGHVTQPTSDKEAGLGEGDYGDPCGFLYPVWLTHSTLTDEQKAQVRNAPARFAQFGDKYDAKSRGVVKGRIEQALRKFGIGAFRETAASVFRDWLGVVEEGFDAEGGDTTVTVEELQQKFTEAEQRLQQLEQQLAAANSGMSEVESAMAEVVRIEATVGVDDPLTASQMLEHVRSARDLLCSTLPEDQRDRPLLEVAKAVIAEIEASRQKVRDAEIEQQAQERFDRIKDRYPEDKHEEVRACCHELAAGRNPQENADKLLDLQVVVQPSGTEDEPPRIDASAESGERKVKDLDGTERSIADIMLEASGRAPRQ